MSYQPPPEGGSSTPPPEGGYSPPPAPSEGGYSPPPAPTGGGYSPPPMTSMTPSGGSPSDMSHLPQSWMNAVTKPNVGTYEAEIPNANILKTMIGIAIVAVVGMLFAFLGAGAVSAQIDDAIRQVRAQAGSEVLVPLLEFIRGLVALGPIFALISPFITFFLGAGVQYLVGRTVGGAQSGDFMTHSYLSSLSYVPLGVVMSALGIIPGIGGCIAFFVRLYQVFSVGVSMQASQRMQSGKAQMSAFSPVLLFVLFIGLCCFLSFVLAALGGGNR